MIIKFSFSVLDRQVFVTCPFIIIPPGNYCNVWKEKEKESQAPKDSRDKAARQMEQGILEAAAADSRYSHLLNKEEEAIVKDVIKEFLT